MVSQNDNDTRKALQHYLAGLAYRTQKALRDAPAGFGSFEAGSGTRTPADLIFHMTGVIGYARTFFLGGVWKPERLPNIEEEIRRFHDVLEDLSQHIGSSTKPGGISWMQMLHGPFSDAMTHVGQIAMLRRLAGSPVASEDFIFADIQTENVSANQALPVAPDTDWKP